MALTVAGCGQSPADQVRAKIEQFAHATATRNYPEICSQILAPSLVAHLTSNGIACSEGLQVALGSVHNPVITVGKIMVTGHTATAIILASAKGQRAMVSALALLDTSHGWRIVSLNSSVPRIGRSGAHGVTGTGTTGGS